MASLAVIGLGAMGSRLAARLLEHGHRVSVWNRTADKMTPLEARGATSHDTAAAAAAQADAVMTMLADPDALIEVTEGPGGVLAGLRDGATLIEMSTVGPSAIERLASKMPEGRSLIDAPVLGSTGEVEAGKLKVFVGSSDDDYERWRPLISDLGEPMHVGPVGSGASAKLVANLTLIVTLGTLGEAIALGDGLGLDRSATFEVLGATPIAAQAERRRDPIENGSFPKRFALALALKDAELVAGAADAAAVDLRMAKAAGSWFADATAAGWGELDYSAVLARITGSPKPE